MSSNYPPGVRGDEPEIVGYPERPRREQCYGGAHGWQTCTACNGRIHKQTCKSLVRPKKDCCPARHLNMGLPANTAQVR